MEEVEGERDLNIAKYSINLEQGTSARCCVCIHVCVRFKSCLPFSWPSSTSDALAHHKSHGDYQP